MSACDKQKTHIFVIDQQSATNQPDNAKSENDGNQAKGPKHRWRLLESNRHLTLQTVRHKGKNRTLNDQDQTKCRD
jgi:hypothetical protein